MNTSLLCRDIGENERQADARIRLADIEATVTEQQNLRKQNIAKSQLELNKVGLACQRDEQTLRVQSDMAPKQKQAELQTELNKLDGIKQQAYLRATDLIQKQVIAEGVVKEAEGKALAQRNVADADLYTEQRRADGIQALNVARVEGLQNFLRIADPDVVKFQMALDSGLFDRMAAQTATAIKGLSPKINVWTTGGADSKEAYAPLRNLFQSVPPMLDAIQSQTNLKLPSWLPQSSSQPAVE